MAAKHGIWSSTKFLDAGFLRSSSSSCSTRSCTVGVGCRSSSSTEIGISKAQLRMVEAFDPKIPLAEAITPPSSWYTDSSFLDLEFERLFFRGWQAVGNSSSLNL